MHRRKSNSVSPSRNSWYSSISRIIPSQALVVDVMGGKHQPRGGSHLLVILRSHDATAMTSAGKSIDPSTAGLHPACLAWLAPHSATTAALQCGIPHCTLLAWYGAGATGGKLRSNVRLSHPTSLNLCLHDCPVLGWALSSPLSPRSPPPQLRLYGSDFRIMANQTPAVVMDKYASSSNASLPASHHRRCS
jgi:hypothetical protein